MKTQNCAILSVDASAVNIANSEHFIVKYSWSLPHTSYVVTNIASKAIREKLIHLISKENPALHVKSVAFSRTAILPQQVYLTLDDQEVILQRHDLLCQNKNASLKHGLAPCKTVSTFFDLIFNTKNFGVFLATSEGLILRVNQYISSLLEVPSKYLLRTSFVDYFFEKSTSKHYHQFREFASSTSFTFHATWNFKTKGSNFKSVAIDAIKFQKELEDYQYLFLVRDETLFKKQQRLLDETEQNAKVGGWELDLISGKLTWTKEIYRIYEVSDDKEINLHEGLKYYDASSYRKLKSALTQGIEKGSSYDIELRMITQNRHEKWVRSTGRVEKHNQQAIRILGTIQDITHKKEAERKLLTSYEALEDIRLALNTANIVLIFDLSGKITYVNENFTEVSHHEPKEIIGKHYQVLDFEYHPKQFFEEISHTITVGKIWKGEVCIRTKKKEMRWITSAIVPFSNKNNLPNRFIFIGSDITIRKNAEQKLLEQYHELEKTNYELDKFVYSVSHDLRAPVVSILGLLQIMRHEFPESDIFMYVRMIEKSLHKTDQILHQIMEYSDNTRTEVQQEPVDLKDLVAQIIKSCRYLKEWYYIEFNVDIIQKRVLLDKLRIQIILDHLISNAVIFHDLEKANPYVFISIQVLFNDLVIRVEDNGIGIMTEERDKIFRMFHRSSEKSQGAGLGLYIVKEALTKLRGSISVVTEEGKGSLFVCKLPVITT